MSRKTIPDAVREEIPAAPTETPARRVLRLFRAAGTHPWVEINTNPGAGAARTLRWGFGVAPLPTELIAEANDLRMELVAELEREDAAGKGDPLAAVRLRVNISVAVRGDRAVTVAGKKSK